MVGAEAIGQKEGTAAPRLGLPSMFSWGRETRRVKGDIPPIPHVKFKILAQTSPLLLHMCHKSPNSSKPIKRDN